MRGNQDLGGRAEPVVQDECRSLDEHKVGKRDSMTLQVGKLGIPVWRAQGAQGSCGWWGRAAPSLWSAPLWVPWVCSPSY